MSSFEGTVKEALAGNRISIKRKDTEELIIVELYKINSGTVEKLPDNKGFLYRSWSWEAKEFLRRTLLLKRVFCDVNVNNEGVYCGKVYTDENKTSDISLALLKEGFAIVKGTYSKELYVMNLYNAQSVAKKSKTGVWSLIRADRDLRTREFLNYMKFYKSLGRLDRFSGLIENSITYHDYSVVFKVTIPEKNTIAQFRILNLNIFKGKDEKKFKLFFEGLIQRDGIDFEVQRFKRGELVGLIFVDSVSIMDIIYSDASLNTIMKKGIIETYSKKKYRKNKVELLKLKLRNYIVLTRDTVVLINKVLQRRKYNTYEDGKQKSCFIGGAFEDAAAACNMNPVVVGCHLDKINDIGCKLVHDEKIEDSNAKTRFKYFKLMVSTATELQKNCPIYFKGKFIEKLKFPPIKELTEIIPMFEILLNKTYEKIAAKRCIPADKKDAEKEKK